MHHPSWLFPGSCSNPHRQDSAFHDIPTNGNNSNSGPTGFEINSFVRSLNRNGIQLPESVILKNTSLSEDHKNGKREKKGDDKVRKSINDFLSVLNESVDHVVRIPSRDRSNSSSFESFRSANEDRDAAAWNDLIQLVSTTAHEFRDIQTAGNPTTGTKYDNSKSFRIASTGHRTLIPNHSRWTYEKFSHNQQLDRAPQSNLKSSRIYGADDKSLKSSEQTKARRIDLDVTPTNDDSRNPELVEIYSEIGGSDGNRVRLGEESLRKIGNFEAPKHLVNEILRAAGNSREDHSSAWVTCNRRINFEDSLWPAGFAMTSNSDFPPYFTGGPNKAFNFRSKIELNSKRFMNVSRSSPIFLDAGEAIAEPSLDILAREHMMADRCNMHLGEEHPIDSRPTKLDKTVANLENVDSQGSKYKQSTDIGTKPSPHVSEKKKKSLEFYKNEADGKRNRGRAKLVAKRGRRICKQFSKKNSRKNVSETEDEDPLDQETKYIGQSPQSPMQRFFEESCQAKKDDVTIGRIKNEDFVESEMRIVSKIRSPTSNHLVKKQLRPSKNTPTNDRCNRCNRIVAADRSRKDFLKVIERPSSTSTRNSDGPKWLNIKCVCDKPNQDSDVKITSSPSIPGNLGQSRIPQCTTPQPQKQNITTAFSTVKNNEVPTVSSAGLKNPPRCTTIETRKLQRPSTAKEISQNRALEVQPQGRTLRPLNSRGTSRDSKKSLNDRGTNASSVNHETTIPVMRSKTFVHQIRRESSVRCMAVKKDCSTVVGERASAKFMLNPSASGPMKQLYRKPWKNSSRLQRDADLSSETNLDDTPIDSRINTDTELSRSVSAVSNSNLKQITCKVEFQSEDSMIRKKESIKVLNANNESTTAKNTFQNKHARSLRMLKSILSHQGVNVEGVNRDAKEIRSRISNDPGKKSQMPIRTGQKRSSPIPESDKNISKTSRTLFEKLAILAEPQSEKLSRSISTTKDSSERCSSSRNLENDSLMSCAKSTKDAADQCSIDYASTMVSETSVQLTKSSKFKDPQAGGSSMDGHSPMNYVDASVSPLPSVTDLSRLESTKSFEVAETQTQLNVVDKDSITDKRYHPVINVCTETETLTREVSIDCCKMSKDIACGKDFLEVPSISKEVNTETPEVFVKSRGVCFRGVRKMDESSQATPFTNSRDTASGRDYVESPGVSELVNTDRQDYLYVDRSVDVFGPKTAEDGCQFEPQLTIVDVAVGECSHGPEISSAFSTIKVVKDFNVSNPTSFTNLDLPNHNYASSDPSRSSLVPWRGTSAEQFRNSINHVPRQAIVALGMVLERRQNLYEAMEIHRNSLAAQKMKLGHESEELNSSGMEGETYAQLETNVEQLQPLLDHRLGLQDEISLIINNLLNNVTGDVRDQDNASQNFVGDEPSLVEKSQGSPYPKIFEVVEDVNEASEENSVPTQKNRQFSLLSRNSLLTVVYGTVCSFVFWALQFSITCDSL